jgi:hypothetical protein
MDVPPLPSVGVATLQSQIREYVGVLTQLKKKREEAKALNETLKQQADDILLTMQEHHIPTCFSMGYTFAVKEKVKMRSATAKNFLQQVKSYFNISDDVMAQFMDHVDGRRRRDAQYLTTLECKTAKPPKAQSGNDAANATAPSSSTPDAAGAGVTTPGTASSLSGAIDEIYS